jgi:endonuclease/exonuclease/phosphatase family metal-dependent hydrolase
MLSQSTHPHRKPGNVKGTFLHVAWEVRVTHEFFETSACASSNTAIAIAGEVWKSTRGKDEWNVTIEHASAIRLLSPERIAALRTQVEARTAALAQQLPWLDTLDVQQVDGMLHPSRLRVAVFNVERGNRFEGIVGLLTSHPTLREVDVMFLNEVDWGMARSGNRHVTREIAALLGLGYVFGIEFLELTKGEAAELEAPGENTWSLHGNAILSRWPLRAPRLLRLPLRCSWAVGSQLRIGGRMALLAELETAAGSVTVACTHLENRTTPAGRRDQMQALLQAIPPGAPAIIGGDLNTSTIDAGDDEQILWLLGHLATNPLRIRRPEPHEPLFADVRDAGFLIDELNASDVPTSVPLGIPDPAYWLKLDWLFARGLGVCQDSCPPHVIVAEHGGTRVSDHDCVVAEIEALR